MKMLPQTIQKLNELYNNILAEDKQLQQISETSKHFIKIEQETLNIFLKELASLR